MLLAPIAAGGPSGVRLYGMELNYNSALIKLLNKALLGGQPGQYTKVRTLVQILYTSIC